MNDLKVLELGCDTGILWAVNLGRIPTGRNITLSDFSEGMLYDARGNIGPTSKKIVYRDALAINQAEPFIDYIY